jgi:hypothetical protein
VGVQTRFLGNVCVGERLSAPGASSGSNPSKAGACLDVTAIAGGRPVLAATAVISLGDLSPSHGADPVARRAASPAVYARIRSRVVVGFVLDR